MRLAAQTLLAAGIRPMVYGGEQGERIPVLVRTTDLEKQLQIARMAYLERLAWLEGRKEALKYFNMAYTGGLLERPEMKISRGQKEAAITRISGELADLREIVNRYKQLIRKYPKNRRAPVTGQSADFTQTVTAEAMYGSIQRESGGREFFYGIDEQGRKHFVRLPGRFGTLWEVWDESFDAKYVRLMEKSKRHEQ